MVTNIWTNSDSDSVYSNGNNWSEGHKPAIGEDVVINLNGADKCVMDENSADALGAFTILSGGEFENGTFTIYFTGSFSCSLGIYTKNTGTFHLKGGTSQSITTGGNALYHVVVSGAGTIYYMKDDTEMFDIDIQTGSTLEIDAVSEGAAISLSFSDIASCGFVSTTAGILLCQGDVTNGVTITSVGSPPTNYWKADITGYSTQNLTHTIVEYFNSQFGRRATTTWTDVTIRNMNGTPTVLATNTTWTNVILDANGKTTGVRFYDDTTSLDNIVISNTASYDIETLTCDIEFTNSNFDATKVNIDTTSTIISDTHNDVAGAWYFWGGATHTRVKSDITNDFISSDNVTIYSGKLVCDEATAHNDLTIKSGGELEVNSGINWTLTNGGTLTVESGGTLDINGTLLSRVTTRSDSPETSYSWDIQSGGIQDIGGIDVQDCDASAGQRALADCGSINSGRNINWGWKRCGAGIGRIGNMLLNRFKLGRIR